MLPDYYTKTQAYNYLQQLPVHWQQSDILEVDTKSYIVFDECWKRFNIFCQENNIFMRDARLPAGGYGEADAGPGGTGARAITDR